MTTEQKGGHRGPKPSNSLQEPCVSVSPFWLCPYLPSHPSKQPLKQRGLEAAAFLSHSLFLLSQSMVPPPSPTARLSTAALLIRTASI